MRFLLLGITLCSFIPGLGQSNVAQPCLIRGVVYADNKPVEHATITVLSLPDSLPLQMQASANNGSFHFSNQCKGKLLRISATGYANQLLPAPADTSVMIINLVPVINDLTAVTVNAERRSVQSYPDRTVVRVDNTPSYAASNAMDILERSPGISVDRDGQISMQGKQGTLLLIDGKKVYVTAQEAANLLRSISAQQIDHIELVPQPSAKYDASGTAGLIHIHTRSGRSTGWSGNSSLVLSAGKYGRASMNSNLFYQQQKLAAAISYATGYTRNFYEIFINRQYRAADNNITTQYNQLTTNPVTQVPHTIRANMDYRISPVKTISLQAAAFMSELTDGGKTSTQIADLWKGKTVGSTDFGNRILRANYSGGISYRQQLANKGDEFSMDADYSYFNRSNTQTNHNYLFDSVNTPVGTPYLLRGDNPSRIDVYSAKFDLVKTNAQQYRWETGAKMSYVSTTNRSDYENYAGGNWVKDARSNHFNYTEKIMAAYLSVKKEFGNWNITAGARLEHTMADGVQLQNNQSFSKRYTNLFPSLSVTKKLENNQTLLFSYSRRIDRPNYQDLNPFQFILNQFTFQQGNPLLSPQFTQAVEAGWSKRNITAKYYFSRITDLISDNIYQDTVLKLSFQQKDNLAVKLIHGVSMNLSTRIWNKLSLSFYTNVFYNRLQGKIDQETFQVEAIGGSANVTAQIQLPKSWSLDLATTYQHRNYLSALLYDKGSANMTIGVGKQLFSNKWNLRLIVRDPFRWQRVYYSSYYKGVDFSLKQLTDSRQISFSISYRFGKEANRSATRKSSAAEEQVRAGAAGS
ncbi:MAG: TonB-dependent receptor [Sediminibacterium sp.]|nr:TonB-dependent receptor [Sediminibacterium sp.]